METVETLNQRLVDEYGIDSSTSLPIFRIVWADNETEKRLVKKSESGIIFVHPIELEVRKYGYLKSVYVLERLVVVPEQNSVELLGRKLSYEPVWVYKTANNDPLPPIWDATKLIVDSLYAALGKKSLRKYIESEKNTTPEGREQRISELQQELFGNETETTDALAYKEGIVVPTNYEKDK